MLHRCYMASQINIKHHSHKTQQGFLYCTAPEPIKDDFLERLAKCQQNTKTKEGKKKWADEWEVMKQQTWGEKFQHHCGTCWTLAWFWSRIWSRAAERAGLANSGIAGAAPRRPGQQKTIRIHSSRISPRPPMVCRALTLLVSLYHWVKQHLEGGRIIETCKYLHHCRIWEETFSPIHSLKRDHKI